MPNFYAEPNVIVFRVKGGVLPDLRSIRIHHSAGSERGRIVLATADDDLEVMDTVAQGSEETVISLALRRLPSVLPFKKEVHFRSAEGTDSAAVQCYVVSE